MSSRVLSLRRPDVCRVCGTRLARGARAHWDASARAVTCLGCLAAASTSARAAAPLDCGHAGASAQREFERRRRNRERGTRERHPRIGGLLLALRGTPQHERAFAQGSRGERLVGTWLEKRTARSGTVILHDRRMPRGRGNIDHLAVAPSGVYVIDAKAVTGKVRVTQPLFGKPRLRVAGRDCTKYADGLDRQTAAVRAALAAAGHAGVRVEGVLCFTKAELPLLGGSRIRGYRLHHRHKLARRLNGGGRLTREAIEELARALAAALQPA